MYLIDLTQQLLDAQLVNNIFGWIGKLWSFGGSTCGGRGNINVFGNPITIPLPTVTLITDTMCIGAEMTPEAASYMTLGLWTQADILFYLMFSPFGLWAPLIYILAFAAGGVSLAIGQPPRSAVWYFVGPALYNFLIGTTVPVHASSWSVAFVQQDMREVWKRTEVGLRNSGLFNRMNTFGGGGSTGGSGAIGGSGIHVGFTMPFSIMQVYADHRPTGGYLFNQNGGQSFNADGKVEVSYIFAWIHELISYQIQYLTQWTGVYSLGDFGLSDLTGHYSNLPKSTSSSSLGSSIWSIITSTIGFGPNSGGNPNAMHLLSKLKWEILANVTGAQLHNTDVRDAFVTFLASECGDELSRIIDKPSLIAATNGTGSQLPARIFQNISTAPAQLNAISVPTPLSLKRLLQSPAGNGSFAEFSSVSSGGSNGYLLSRALDNSIRTGELGQISCKDYLWYLMHAFRWEAGHIYHQLSQVDYAGVSPDQVVYSLFYGWDIKKLITQGLPGIPSLPGPLGNIAGGLSGILNRIPGGGAISSIFNGGSGGGGTLQPLDNEDRRYFMQDLILLHLFRNEYRIAPRIVKPGNAESSKVREYAEYPLRNQGATGKFSELYVWAKMMPHLQGLLLYVLAVAYPFACLLIVVPGFHKILLTWFSFYLWVKLWDVGFAIVMVLERTVWANLGNSLSAAASFSKVVEMQSFARMNVACDPNDPLYGAIAQQIGRCAVPVVTNLGGVNGGPMALETGTLAGMSPVDAMFQVFDRALLLGASLDLDLMNGYYLFIMSALYFAVPVVMGQAVLGSRAGAAGMIGSFTQGASQAASTAGTQAETSEMMVRANNNNGVVGAAMKAKNAREQGAALAALEAGNKSLDYGLGSATLDAATGQLGIMRDAIGSATQANEGAITRTGKNASYALGLGKGAFDANSDAYSEAAKFNKLLGGGAGGGGTGASGENIVGGGGGDSTGKSGWPPGNMLTPAIDAATVNAIDDIRQQGLAQIVMNGMASADMGIGRFGAQQMGQGMGQYSQAVSGTADFGAAEATHLGMQSYSQDVGGILSAGGALGGAINAGAKSSDLRGMGGFGYLGGNAQSETFYAGRGFQSNVSAAQGALQGAYGSDAVGRSFSVFPASYTGAGAYMAGSLGRGLTNQGLPNQDTSNGNAINFNATRGDGSRGVPGPSRPGLPSTQASVPAFDSGRYAEGKVR